MQESFMEQIFQTWEQNFALILLPIVAIIMVIGVLCYLILQKRRQSQLSALKMKQAVQRAKILAPRVRVKIKPFVGQGSQHYYRARGSNVRDIQGTLYLLREDQYEEKDEERGTKHILREDTAAIINWRKGRFAVFRVSGLHPHTSLLSRMGYKPWRKIATMSLGILWIIILGQIIYEIMITFAIFEQQEPTFLFDPGIFGWYFAFGLLIASWFIIENVKDGYYADCWYAHVTQEDVRVEMDHLVEANDAKAFIIPQVEVYSVYRMYHDYVSPGDLLDSVNSLEIAQFIEKDQTRRISELSGDNTNLQTKNDQLEKQLALKQIEMSELKDHLEEVRMEGVTEGLKLARRNTDILQRGFSAEGIFSVLKALGPGTILAIAGIIIFTQLPVIISDLKLDPSVFILLLLGVIGILLFAGVLFVLALREMLRGGGARLN